MLAVIAFSYAAVEIFSMSFGGNGFGCFRAPAKQQEGSNESEESGQSG